MPTQQRIEALLSGRSHRQAHGAGGDGGEGLDPWASGGAMTQFPGSHLRVQPRPAVQKAPQGQAGSPLASEPGPARPDDLAAAQRPRLRNSRRPLLTVLAGDRAHLT